MRACLQCGSRTEAAFCARDGTATIVYGRRPTTSHLEPGTLFAGRYRIQGEIGRGGMGAVYEALHTGTSQPVAIKTLLLDIETDEATVRRFYQEARISAGLQHPSTIRVFDFGQSDDGVFYLAMERLRGETLGERMRKLAKSGQVLGEVAATRVAIAALRSLAEAHRSGLVHRDLKPMNIFLHEIGGETIVKVLDFGIAKSEDTGLTRTGTTVGTPSYMSPEQVLNRSVDGRADLYALGVILYGCVSGCLPFTGDSSQSIMMKHVDEPPPALARRLRAPTSEAFVAVVERALAKQPEDRFASAGAMREALEQAAVRREEGTVRMLHPMTGAASRFAIEATLSASVTALAGATWLRDKRTWVAAGAVAATLCLGLLTAFGRARPTTADAPSLAASAPSAVEAFVAPARTAASPLLPPPLPADQPPAGPVAPPTPQPPALQPPVPQALALGSPQLEVKKVPTAPVAKPARKHRGHHKR